MKKAITVRLCIVILLSMIAITFLSYYLQIKSAKDAMYNNSLLMSDQISQILERNDAEIEQLKEQLKEDYFIRAKAAAYIVQKRPEVIGDQTEMKKIASLLQVDELHLFDTEGTLYAGSVTKYFNYTFNSGEQMQFFLPMLEDYSLQLCQDVTPNTAESKLMQYIAVWSEDHQRIIQIGMEPIRLLAAMEKNELSHLFTMITAEEGITLFIIDPKTGDILGATNDTLTGKKAEDMGIELAQVNQSEEGIVVEIGGKKNYCVIQPTERILVGFSTNYENLYQNIWKNMVLVIFSLCILSVVIILLILLMLDKFIIYGIYKIIDGMKKITAGDLDFHVEVTNTSEFVELSSNINTMVKSLLEVTSKLSLVFENVNIPIAVYEYNQDMKRVLATSKIGDILMLSEKELHKSLSNREIFLEKIQQICNHPFEEEKNIYLFSGDMTHYVKIKSYQEEHRTFGIVVDVTEEIIEKQGIKLERDIDLLTGLFNRRAFFAEMDKIFSQLEILGIAALLMADVDNLKNTNDNWGHEYGDKLLRKAADLLRNCKAPFKVASRLSGDEFVLVIYGAESQKEIQGYLDDLYNQMVRAVMNGPNQETISVSMSGGYLFYPEVETDYREMLRIADQTMYQVKKSTKGHFAKYQPDICMELSNCETQ